MKKTLRLFLFICAALCGALSFVRTASAAKPSVVVTTFPAWDWTRQIAGERLDSLDLAEPLASGVDMHSYQPGAGDILRIAQSDLFICTGGLSDAWVERLPRGGKQRIDIKLLAALGDRARDEETVEGMESEHHNHHEHHEHHHEHENEPDEHVWLSLRNARILCAAIADALIKIDPAGEATYRANFAAYAARLDELDAGYRGTVESAKHKTLLFADRFPFRYLADDYGLKYYAAFKGCSAESEASFKTVLFLAGKLDELNLPCALIIDGSDGKIARTVVATAKSGPKPILALDSLQSVLPVDYGTTSYLAIMERNLETLTKALNDGR